MRKDRILERRSQQRYEVRLDGELIWDNGAQRKSCVILDLSVDGARIDTGYFISLPKNLFFLEKARGTLFECQVRWQQAGQLGLHFIDVSSRAARRTLIDQYAAR
jgi:hypothetical protein